MARRKANAYLDQLAGVCDGGFLTDLLHDSGLGVGGGDVEGVHGGREGAMRASEEGGVNGLFGGSTEACLVGAEVSSQLRAVDDACEKGPGLAARRRAGAGGGARANGAHESGQPPELRSAQVTLGTRRGQTSRAKQRKLHRPLVHLFFFSTPPTLRPRARSPFPNQRLLAVRRGNPRSFPRPSVDPPPCACLACSIHKYPLLVPLLSPR